ncbi:M12 family metallo-peptidase [Tenacibaculum agarivorans]|uniref:M12 family metallo-peptidase n=1 Tax=Tenacibaculum agarivorans TaxID=1908389 RepID=UPI00094B80DA|nr:M12 family metallo-peptidase [Tenacibaculum agarivorans]
MKTNFMLLAFCMLAISLTSQTQKIKPKDRIISAQLIGKKFEEIKLFNFGKNSGRKQRVKIPKEFKNYELLSLSQQAMRRFSNANASPEAINLPLPNKSSILILQLVKVAIKSENFTSIELPAKQIVKPSNITHYRGIVKNKNNSRAAISIQDGEVYGYISLDNVVGNFVLGKVEGSTNHILYEDKDISHLNNFICQADESYYIGTSKNIKSKSELPQRRTGKCPEIFFDIANDVVRDKGSTSAASVFVEAMFNQVAILYNDEGINLKLSGIRAWTSTAPFNDLDSYRSYRNRNGFNGDLGHFVTYNYSGGVAWLDALCGSYRYGLSGIYRNYSNVPRYSWNISTIAHELGHNFGSSHTHACVWNGNNTAIDGCYQTEGNCSRPGAPSDGGTIMSYCHLNSVGTNLRKGFGSQPANVIRRAINNANCVDSCSDNGGGGNDGEVSCAGVEEWSGNTNYSSGDRVVYNGRLFERTGNNDWNDLGACSSDNCYGVKEWKSDTTYIEGDLVVYQGNLFKRENNNWTSLGSCDNQNGDPCSGIDPWQENTNYQAGDKVIYQGKAFEWDGSQWIELATCTSQPGVKLKTIDGNNFTSMGLQIYPNPVKEYLSFKVTDMNTNETKVDLMNILGKLILTKNISGISPSATISEKIDVRVLPKGIYLLKVTNGDKSIAKKIMIK